MHVRSLALALSVSLTAVGCAANQVDDDSREASSEALVLDTNAPEHVAGRYAKDGASLGFDFTRHGDDRVATLRDTEGRTLLVSTLEGGIEHLVVGDGALVASGAPDALDPKLEGDAGALETLGKTKEMALLGPLQEALAARGVERALFDPSATPAGGITTKQYLGSDGYWRLGPGEQRTFGTWAFWTPTYVRIRNFNTTRCATVTFSVGLSFETNVIPARGYRGFSRKWAAMPVTIRSVNGFIDWGNGQICGPSTIGAMTQ